MPRHTPLVFLLIVGLSFIDTTHADELVSSGVEPSSALLKTFIIDFDSASLKTRQTHGIDLDFEGISDARDAAAKALPGKLGMVKRSWLVVFDSAAFEPGFFDGPLLVELPTGQSCVAHPRSIRESKEGVTTWMGRCESSVASDDKVIFSVFPGKRYITGTIRWGAGVLQSVLRAKSLFMSFTSTTRTTCQKNCRSIEK